MPEKKTVEKKKKKKHCEAGTPLCSGSLIARYGVNGSEKKNETFLICGVCKVYLTRGGAKFKQVPNAT